MEPEEEIVEEEEVVEKELTPWEKRKAANVMGRLRAKGSFLPIPKKIDGVWFQIKKVGHRKFILVHTVNTESGRVDTAPALELK